MTTKQIDAEWLSRQLCGLFKSFTKGIGSVPENKEPWQADRDGECWQFVIRADGREFDVVVRERD